MGKNPGRNTQTVGTDSTVARSRAVAMLTLVGIIASSSSLVSNGRADRISVLIFLAALLFNRLRLRSATSCFLRNMTRVLVLRFFLACMLSAHTELFCALLQLYLFYTIILSSTIQTRDLPLAQSHRHSKRRKDTATGEWYQANACAVVRAVSYAHGITDRHSGNDCERTYNRKMTKCPRDVTADLKFKLGQAICMRAMRSGQCAEPMCPNKLPGSRWT